MTALLYVLGVAVFLVALFVSIALHELGHLAFARRFGCRVSEYMIGFGPTLFSRTRGETTYGVKLVPLGGYVKIIGMFPPATAKEHRTTAGVPAEGSGHTTASTSAPSAEPASSKRSWGASATTSAQVRTAIEGASEDEPVVLRTSNTGMFSQFVARTREVEFELVEPGDRDRLFYKLPTSKKFLVMFAGPATNILIAFVCFQGVYALHGTQSTEPTGSTVIASVAECVIPERENRTDCTAADPASPAQQAGLRPGDEITSFNGQAVSSWEQLSSYIHGNGAGGLQLTVIRDGQEVVLDPTVTVTMQRNVTPLTDLSPDAEPVYEEVGFLGASPETRTVVTRHGPVFTATQMIDMAGNAVTMIVQMPAKVWNVVMAVAGFEERSQDGPMSVIGGSRVAGEVASSDNPGLDVGSKVTVLGVVVGSFNLFIGLFNLIPLMPFDGGHIVGTLWEGLRRWLARKRALPDPGHVNVAAQLPIAYCLGIAMVVMGFILMVGDLLVPLSSGF